jgi:lipopolysaccharide assembly outer membrane protein LptD (OstA)
MFCRFKIEQSYDIYEEKEDDKTGLRNGVTKEPFYPLYMEFEVYPVSYLTLRGDAKWTFYEEEFLNQNIQLNFKDATGNSMALEYRYKRDPLESIHKSENLDPKDWYDSSENITLAFNINALDPFSIHGEYERDLFEQEDVMFGIGFLYSSSCWSLDVYYKDEDDEQKYAFMVNLHGLGGLGTGI